ncbi:MAG: ABC transporter permease [Thermoplasmata archaeon]|nr:ABC transporter permease [Thermoplasmata archaeon]
MIGLIAVSIILTAAPTPPGDRAHPLSWNFAATYSYTTEFVFEFYVFDGNGHPLGGALATVTFVPFNSTSGAVVTGSATTNSSGLASFSIQEPDRDLPVDYAVEIPGVGSEVVGSGVEHTPSGQLSAGPGVFTWLKAGPYDLRNTLQLFFMSPTGPIPTGSLLRTNVTDGSNPPLTLSSVPIPAVQPAEVAPPSPDLAATTVLTFEVLAPDGSILAFIQDSPTQFQTTDYKSTVWGEALDTTLIEWTFLASMAGVLLGYEAYGRDRKSRSLEPVLALPTTDAGLLIGRLLAAFVAVTLSAGVGALIDLVAAGRIAPQVYPVPLLAALCMGVVLLGLAFLSLTVFLSRVSRSSWVIVGTGGFLAVTLIAVWTTVGRFFTIGSGYGGLGSQSSPLTWLALAIARDYFATLGSPPGLVGAASSALVASILLTSALVLGSILGAVRLAQTHD